MEKEIQNKENTKVINTHWMDSIQAIVEKTKNNLQGVGSKDEVLKMPASTPSPYPDDNFSPQRSSFENKTLLQNFKFARRSERDKVCEIEQDLLFQKFHQEIIKNFNQIDRKIVFDSQRNQRDIINVRGDLEDLRRVIKELRVVNNNFLDRGELERDIENVKNQTDLRLLEQDTNQKRCLTDLNEDLSKKLNLLQDQLFDIRRDMKGQPQPQPVANTKPLEK